MFSSPDVTGYIPYASWRIYCPSLGWDDYKNAMAEIGYLTDGSKICYTSGSIETGKEPEVAKSKLVTFDDGKPSKSNGKAKDNRIGFVPWHIYKSVWVGATWDGYAYEMGERGFPENCQEMLDEASLLERMGGASQYFEPKDGKLLGGTRVHVGKQSSFYSSGWDDDFKGTGSSLRASWQGSTYVSKDRHAPTHVLTGKGEWEVFAGSESKVTSHANEYDVVINLTGYSLSRPPHSIPIPALAKYAGQSAETAFLEVDLDWPDHGVPKLPAAFWRDLYAEIQANHWKVLVFCVGGHGRTGTAIACLMCAMGFDGAEAVRKVRSNYCKHAIESKAQEGYVLHVGKKLKKVKE